MPIRDIPSSEMGRGGPFVSHSSACCIVGRCLILTLPVGRNAFIGSARAAYSEGLVINSEDSEAELTIPNVLRDVIGNSREDAADGPVFVVAPPEVFSR